MFYDGKIDSFSGKYHFLSNFYSCQVSDGFIFYTSVEHGYAAAKTLDPNLRVQVANISSPSAAKRFGRTLELRKDWESIKADVMYALLIQKFSEPILLKLLLETGNKELIEGNTWGDTYWGVCEGVGQNVLGNLLMKIRDEVKVLAL